MKSHTITGTNETGNTLVVGIYAKDEQSARDEFRFRYGGLGYKTHDDSEEAPAPAPVTSAVRVRTRSRKQSD